MDDPFVLQVDRTDNVPCGAELIRGNPFPTFLWQRKTPGGVNSDLTERFSVVTETGEMMVRDPRLEDSGMYLCTAMNEVASVVISVELLVLGKCGSYIHVDFLVKKTMYE